MSELVTDSIEGDVAIIRLNDPDRVNAISLEMREALAAALQRRLMDNECVAIVLAGSGGNFSSGGDIKAERPSPEMLARTLRHKLAKLQELVRMITSSPKPVVAAVEGKALGAGMSLALCCDMVVAANTAQFGAVFGKVGLLPDAGLLYTLPRRIGAARAQRMLLSARIHEAPHALQIGLCDMMVPAEELMQRACTEAHRLGQIAPLAFASIKSIGTADCATLDAAFAQEMRLQPLLAMTQDNLEARTAFAERRKPKFRGC
jgi:enoyl-CoA hydratase/carnithine racemase